MRLRFERDLRAPPVVVWPYLAEPRGLNRWSRAKARLLAAGDGGRPDSVGALRRLFLRLPGGPILSLDEVIEAADPPRFLSYSVIRGAPVRWHHGEMRL